MTCQSLPDFLEVLENEGELCRVDASVNPQFEIPEIHRRVIADNGPALLFRNVKGSPFPLATNLFGTPKRVELAFGRRPKELLSQIAKAPETLIPPTLSKLWEHRSLLRSLLSVGMKTRRRSSRLRYSQKHPRLSELPLLTTWPEDGGAFFTLPLVYTEEPTSGVPNLGMYRLQRFDDTSTGFHCQIGKGAGFHLAAAAELKQPLPVNVTVGGPPALILSAIAPLPENVPELLIASLVMGRKLQLSRNPFGPLPLFEGAEMVIVGTVDPEERAPEGPFGDHYGYYSLQHDYPVFRAKALLRTAEPIVSATVVGKPRQEDFFIGDYLQELLSPLFPLVMPAVRDLWSYGETGFHSLAAAVVKERYHREAMGSAFRILGEGQLSLTKFLLLLNEPRDLRDFKSVLSHVLERADFRRDLFIFSNLSMDTLDYTGPKVNEGSKGVLVGIGDPIRELPKSFTGKTSDPSQEVSVFSPGCLVVSAAPFEQDRDAPTRIAQHEPFSEWPLIVVVDNPEEAVESVMSFLWTTFTRFEPAADIFARETTTHRHHICYSPPIVIDARMKPWYPGVVQSDPETQSLVTKRWDEYGISL